MSIGDEAPARSSAMRHRAIVVVLQLLAVWMIWPVAEIGVGDDWSYTHTAMKFAETGHFVFNGWSEAALGAMAVWGALWAKIFGSSFLAVRLSTLPLVLAIPQLLYGMFRRLRLNENLSFFAALAFALCPLTTMYGVTFMTDIPATFFVIASLAALQRALDANESEHGVFIAWAATAVASAIAGGTVRQPLVITHGFVFATAAFLSSGRRRTVFALATVLCLASFAVVQRWFLGHEYAIAAPITPALKSPRAYPQGAINIVQIVMDAVLYAVPCALLAGAALLARWRGWTVALFALIVAAVAFGYQRNLHLGPNGTLVPWAGQTITAGGFLLGGVNDIGERPVVVPVVVRAVATVLMLFAACGLAAILWAGRRRIIGRLRERPMEAMFVAFTAAYLGLQFPRAMIGYGLDRYMLPVIPLLMYWLLTQIEPGQKRWCVFGYAALLFYAVGGVALWHDHFAKLRAQVDLTVKLERAGIPRSKISMSEGFDGWSQIMLAGTVNRADARTYVRRTDEYGDGRAFYFLATTPDVRPAYFVSNSLIERMRVSATFSPMAYRNWLSPRDRVLYVCEPEPGQSALDGKGRP